MHEYGKLRSSPDYLNSELERDGLQVAAIDNQIDSMRAEEKRLLSDRTVLWDESASYSRLMFLGGIAIIYLLTALVFIILQKQVMQGDCWSQNKPPLTTEAWRSIASRRLLPRSRILH